MSSVPTEERLGELLLRWDELRQQGCDVSAGELCGEFPELADELRRRIEVVRGLEPVLDVEPTHLAAPPGGGLQTARGAIAACPKSFTPPRFTGRDGTTPQGGLGEVLAAHQEELGRTVALKRIRSDRLQDTARRRFLREAAITARLQHPGIVPIYGLGQDRDGPFYSMPFIEGRTLQEAIDAFHGDESLRRDPGRRALEIRGLLQQFIAVCNTMAYAHDQGVIHRDLKPSNIMLGPYGEALVMDWGLAKLIGMDNADDEVEGETPAPSPPPDALTATGAVLGTLCYMSPEQAEGRMDLLGPRSDVYCLGATLYHLLTGHVPCEAEQGADAQQKVISGDILRPRSINPGLASALEAICLKAMASKPEDRYESVKALKSDLERWLADEPVKAHQEPWRERLRRWERKHQVLVTSAAAVVIMATCAAGVVALQRSAHTREIERRITELSVVNSELLAQRARALARERLQSERDFAVGQSSVADFLTQTGKLGDAVKWHGIALLIQTRLADAHPSFTEFQSGVARTKEKIGALLVRIGNPAEGLKSFQAALEIWAKLAAANPSLFQFRLVTCTRTSVAP